MKIGLLQIWRPVVGGLEILGSDFELAEGDGAVVALDEDVVFGGKALALGGASVSVNGDVFLDEFSVEMN